MSRAVLLHDRVDRRIHEFFITNSHPPAEWVHRLWSWLLARGENPIFATVEDMSSGLPEEAGDRAGSACLYVLVREGMIRRIAPSDRAATVRLDPHPPTTAPQGTRGKVWAAIRARQVAPGEALQLQPDAWCRELDITREQLHASLGGLDDRGYLRYRPAERIGGVELLRPDDPLVLDEKRMAERRSREFQKLDRMDAYANARCRRRYVVEYFGEKAPWERCGTCDACRQGRPVDEERPLSHEEEVVVLKLLSCVARMERHAKKRGFSADWIAKVALGSREEGIVQLGFDQLSTWGVLGPRKDAGRPIHWTTGELADVLHVLVHVGCLEEEHVTRRSAGKERTEKVLALTERGWRVLKREETELRMAFPHARKLERPKAPTSQAARGVPGELLSILKDVRQQLAEEHAVPAYVVAPNKTLEDMATIRPTTRRAMLTVHAMGPQRYQRYGSAFLEAIRAWSSR